jgi:hypothetical protein
MMIVVVMACNAISNNGARDGADGAANYTARDRAAHKSVSSAIAELARVSAAAATLAKAIRLSMQKNPFVKVYAILSPRGDHWFQSVCARPYLRRDALLSADLRRRLALDSPAGYTDRPSQVREQRAGEENFSAIE